MTFRFDFLNNDEVKSFVEWTEAEKGNAQLATTQSLVNRSFEVMAEISRKMGNKKEAERYLETQRTSKETTTKLLWNTTKKAYFDSLKDGQKMENAKTTEHFMRKNWQNMVFDDNDCTWEDFGTRNGQRSKSHGWSGAPTWYLSSYVLGVQLGFPESTDLSIVTIAPQAETITWAKGVVPHPTGSVSVDWKIQGENLFLNYKAAKEIQVIVKPKGRLKKKVLWVNGKKK